MEEKRVRRFNIWNHAFTGEELTDDLISAGFKRVSLYGDIAGAQCSETSKPYAPQCKPENTQRF